ncbi:right-handed parallel beta-helix repeat-containing protein [Planctopirus hydrillae]|nr:right-handed parallel beta-helix repeat-containing protein [Planctopirus hydrillae]
MPLTKPSLASALLLAMAAPAVAQSVEDELGVATMQDFSGGGMLNGTYFDVRNQSNSGVGYQHGFTQIGALTPLLNDGQFLIAPQARLLITDTSKIGVNVGLIGRVYDAGRDRIWGANVYYDNDETTYSNRYSQIGFGFESLGQNLDLRANAYLPTGSSDKVIGPNGLSNTLFYTGNQLNFTGSYLSEEALRGADFELGVPVSQNMSWLRAYGGGYFYDATQNNVSGVRGRLDAQLSTDLTAGVIATHDSTFKTRVNAYVEWRFAGFVPTVWFPRLNTQDRMLTSVQRNWRVSTTTYSTSIAIPVINPRDDQAYFITWVDSANPNGGTGTGTYEDPLTQLPANSPPADLILVRQGNSGVTPYNNSITLTDFQRLLGEGKVHQIEGYANYGPFSIPQQTFTLPEFDFNDPSRYPTLTSTGGNVVTLASNNEVSAFNIQDALGSGITNTPGGSTNFLLQNLNITNNNTAGSATAGGIYLSNVDGTGTIRTVTTSNNQGFGTRIAADADLDLLLDGLASTGNQLDNLNISGASGADIDVALTSTGGANAFTGSTAGSGIVMSIDNATGTFASTTPIDASGNALDGIRLESTSGIVGTVLNPVLLNGADLSNNGRDALSLIGTGAGANISVAGANIDGTSAGRHGFNIDATAGANVTANLSNSQFGGAGANGLNAVLDAATGTVLLTNVDVSNNGQATGGTGLQDAINLDLANASSLGLGLTDVIGDGGATQERGLVYNVASGSSLTVNGLRGSFDNNLVNAINGVATGAGSIANVSLDGFTGNNAGADAVVVSSLLGATQNFELLNGTFNLATGNGLNFTASGASTLNTVLEDVTVNGSGADGMLVSSTGGSTFTGVIQDSFLTGSTLSGLNVTVSDANSVATFGAIDSQFNGNGEEGLVASATAGGELNFRSVGSQFNGNGTSGVFDGVNVTADGANTIARTLFADSESNNNTGDGYDFAASNGAYMTARIDTSTATNNQGFGVQMAGTGAGTTAVLLMEGDNDISGNTLGQYNATFTNVDTAIVSLSGSFNNGPGNGVNVNMTGTGTGTGLVLLNGATGQTIDGNAGNGVNISMTNLLNAGVTVAGYDSISNNTLDGININLDTILGAAAVNLTGPTVLSANGDNAIDIALTNVALGALPPGVGTGTYSVLTRTDNDVTEPRLPVPVDLALNSLATLPTADGIVIDSMLADTSGTSSGNAAGIAIVGDTVTNGSGTAGIVVTNSQSNTTTNGAGLLVSLLNSTTPGTELNLDINTNTFSNNDLDGVLVTLDGSNLNTLNISDNVDISGNGGSGIVVDLTNGSTVATTTINNNLLIDANALNGIQLVVNGSDFTNGVELRGNTITGSVAGDGISVVDPTTTAGPLVLTIAENTITGNGGNGVNLTATTGGDFSGSVIDDNTIDSNLANGINLTLVNSTADNFQIINNSSISGNTLDGINIDLDNSSFANFLIDSNGLGGGSVTPISQFNIEVVLLGGLTPSQQAIFAQASARWSQLITGDLADVDLGGGDIIDDLRISAEGVAIDGAGGILGQAGPTGIRAGSNLPYNGIMRFDSADLASLEASGQLYDVILHEMGHVLGIGTVWNLQGLLQGAGTADPRFTGAQATAEYNARFANVETGVPVENTGGPGTRDSHWRESIYDNELMTGFLNPGVDNPISRTTTASLADQGYVVNINASDPYLQAITTGSVVSTPSADAEVVRTNNFVVTQAMAPHAALANIANNGLHGIEFNVVNSTIGGTISNNTIDGHTGGDGIRMINPTSGSSIDIVYDANTITNNTGGAGINLAANSTTILNQTFTNNTIDNNGDQGVNLVLADTAQATMTFTDNASISANGAEGVNFLVQNGSQLTTTFANNRVNNNTGIGINVVANGTNANAVNLTMEAGANPSLVNIVDNNRGAGVAVSLSNTAGANVDISGTTISNTQVGTVAGYAGQGLSLRGVGSATFIGAGPTDGITIGDATNASTTIFNSNAAEGIEITLTDNTLVPNVTVDAITVQNINSSANGSHGFSLNTRSFADVTDVSITGSTFNANTGTGDGLHFDREADSFIRNVLIDNNIITGNSDGIDITARARDLDADVYTISNNTIDNNRARGIAAQLVADADLQVDIDTNSIQNNGGDGIQFSVNAAVTDSPTIDSLITGNTVVRNGGDGIDISVTHLVDIVTNEISDNGANGIIITGSSAGTDLINDNFINSNESNGIVITSGGSNTALITNNVITFSGNDGVQLASNGTATLNIAMDNNLVGNSQGDGVQLVASGVSSATLTMTRNDVADSQRRGLNILNRGSAGSTVNIGDGTSGNQNQIRRSELEGIYIINTASSTQNVDALADTALAADGSIFNTPTLVLNINTNEITANGRISDSSQVFDTTGLVVRVGTADGGNGFTDAGGFADTRAGVVASVTNNIFGGHFGADVTFESFVSTVTPNTTGGAWSDQNTNPRDPTNDVFTPSGYQSDPLARLDLIFTGNSGEGIIATRTGAFYNNNESVFKSRTITQDNNTDGGADDNGPFTNGTRERNAQRQANRTNLPPTLVIGTSPTFLFPGMGASTFRVNANVNQLSGGNTGFAGTPFIFDVDPYNDFTDANGISTAPPGPSGVDTMPYGWGVLP